ncbi:MAG: hypothetical protein WBD40_17305 [Tepidisphaeraceae bacterium]
MRVALLIAAGITIVIGAMAVVISVVSWKLQRIRRPQRGFEVKTTTGEPPVPREEHKAD